MLSVIFLAYARFITVDGKEFFKEIQRKNKKPQHALVPRFKD